MTTSSKTSIYKLAVFLALLLIAGYQLLFTDTFAQTSSQIIITWQANNFYPANYEGRALVTPNSPVVLASELLRNNKLVDTTQATFSWILDGKLLGSGRGLKEISFVSKKQAGDNHLVRVSIKIGEETFENSARIEVSEPVVVIEIKSPSREIRAGEEVKLQTIPYFFNVSSVRDLKFFWRVGNAKEESEGENRLTLSISRSQDTNQKTLQVFSTVQNKRNPLEFKNKTVQLKISK